MKLKPQQLVTSLALTLLLAGCARPPADSGSDSGPTDSGSAASSAPATDQWLGQWNGPEGTFLRLAGGQGTYEITIQNLDGPRTFRGSSVGDHIQFERDGVQESLRATDGAATGMKWLSDKSDCLTVRPGEGYCRD